MSARQSRISLAAPFGILVAVGVAVLLLPGCDTDSYSEDMIYPVREDPIVEQSPSADPKRFERPGQWPYLLPVFDETSGKKYDPSKLSGEQRGAFQKLLADRFGTPAKPTVQGIDDEARLRLRLDNDTLTHGSQLYRRHCLHCHGLTGDGHGPTAPWVNPHPRDYRPGMFKFTSTTGGKARKPTRADLSRTLKQGVEGTSMPSFGLLPEGELNDIISYVIHLSLRGQLEYQLMRELFEPNPSDPSKTDAATVISGADETLTDTATQWVDADSQPIPVAKYPVEPFDLTSKPGQESIRRGHQLFLGLGVNAASCMSCHADYGRQLAYKYDSWGTIVRPRDMTAGVFRGGRRPIDIYYRIFNGINGTPMPAYVTEADEKKKQKQMEQVWDLANFIQAVPYPAMLPKEVRDQVYAQPRGGEPHAAAANRD